MDSLVANFFRVQLLIKINHWQTNSYSRHKATDALLQSLLEKIDRFVECLQGSRDKKVKFGDDNYIQLVNVSDNEIVRILKAFTLYLRDMDSYIEETDLLNLRDEMLADVHQALYLFTLS